MKEQRWTLYVRDEHGRRYRGIVSYGDSHPDAPPMPPAKFHIAFLASPAPIDGVPAATAVCVPRLAKAASEPVRHAEVVVALRAGSLPRGIRAQYAAGKVLIAGGEIETMKVFPHGRAEIEIEPLALVLIDRARAEQIAPFVALIRRELGLLPGSDALLSLDVRLVPARAEDRPPARAPAVRRLKSLLKALRMGTPPAFDAEALTEDLRFLRLFESEDHALHGAALDRLLSEVLTSPSGRRTKQTRARVVPLRRNQS